MDEENTIQVDIPINWLDYLTTGSHKNQTRETIQIIDNFMHYMSKRYYCFGLAVEKVHDEIITDAEQLQYKQVEFKRVEYNEYDADKTQNYIVPKLSKSKINACTMNEELISLASEYYAEAKIYGIKLNVTCLNDELRKYRNNIRTNARTTIGRVENIEK